MRRIFIGSLAALILLCGALSFYLSERDPLGSLRPAEHHLAATYAPSSPQAHRQTQHINLHTDTLGDIGLTLSLPDPLPSKKLPILLVLGGLGSGEENIKYITDAGENAVIGYDWPLPVRFYSGLSFLTQMPDFYERLMTVPGQIASSIGWLTEQSWADAGRISILGFSLGALAAPAAEDLVQEDSKTVGWTIIAYGGAPLGALFAANPHIKPEAMRFLLGPLIDLALRPLEPTQHLPHLSGHFLVLEGRQDHLIPETARDNLRESVPEPKTVIVFDGNHMGVGKDKMALLEKIVDASRTWLIENGAVNKP